MAIALFVVGLTGVLIQDSPQKANKCFRMGVFILVSNIIHIMYSTYIGINYDVVFPIRAIRFSMLNMPLPLLYSVAAYKSKKYYDTVSNSKH